MDPLPSERQVLSFSTSHLTDRLELLGEVLLPRPQFDSEPDAAVNGPMAFQFGDDRVVLFPAIVHLCGVHTP